MHFDDLKNRTEQSMLRSYSRYPLAIKTGAGSRLWDFEGREYIDLLGGIAVAALGHSNPEIAEVVCKQAKKLLHVSNLFYQEEQILLAEKLVSTSHCTKTFFCNSGAEANEAAIKLARRYMRKVKKRDSYEIITLDHCFHGRTLATIAATGQARFQDGFLPMPEGFIQTQWGSLEALEKNINGKTAAVMLEMVQGEGGIRPVTRAYAQGVQDLCRKHDILLILDEIQTGLCRSGKWWSFQLFDLQPDIFTTAKALANGIPMGAMLTTDEIAQGFDHGSHGSTFGGNALASAAALKTLEIMERDRLDQRAAELGAWAVQRFNSIGKKFSGTIREVRGVGLLLGIDLAFPGRPVWEKLLDRGFIINLTQETVLRLLPALNIDQADLEYFAQTLEELLGSAGK